MHHLPPVVLIVDDHQDSLAMYAFGLLAMGFQPVTAENGEDAFERACQYHPDVIVTDVTLPGVSGLELSRRLRDDTRTRNIAIIVLTGHAIGSSEAHASRAEYDRFVMKPCAPDVLAVEIRAVLTARERSA